MNPWEIVAQEDKSVSSTPHRLVLLRNSAPFEPYKIYVLNKTKGYWDLVDRFSLAETDGTEAPDWALERAWKRFNEKKSRSNGGQREKA